MWQRNGNYYLSSEDEFGFLRSSRGGKKRGKASEFLQLLVKVEEWWSGWGRRIKWNLRFEIENHKTRKRNERSMSLAAFFCSMVGRVSGRWGGGGGGDSGRMRHNLLNILSRSINIITGSSHPVSRLINKLTWYFSQKNDFYGCHIGPLKFYTERNGRNLYFAIKLSGYGMPSEVFLRCCCCCSLRSLSVPWNLFFFSVWKDNFRVP